MFTSQVIQYNVFHVSCLGIWWLHHIPISGKLKLDFLNTEKSFQSEIKTFFLILQVLSFRLTKQSSKNVADTTLNPFKCQPHKMIKHTQTIRRQIAVELFEFDHFVELALKGLINGLIFLQKPTSTND